MTKKLDCEYIIVGAGLSGLACATVLERAGADWQMVEAAPRVGGRVQSDLSHQGYILDRGFQVLNSAYPALHSLIDLDRLKLGHFAPGAEVRWNGRFHRLGDPLRTPQDLLSTLAAPVGGVADKLKILELVRFCANPANHNAVEGMSSEEFLCHFGFSEVMVERFFRPFFSGVFLEEELLTSARKLVSLFSYFSKGRASLPSGGMQSLPELLASELNQARIHLSQPVASWKKNSLEGPELRVKAKRLILAGWEVQELLLGLPRPATHQACTVWFSAGQKPGLANRYLRLNGSGAGVVQTVAFNSCVQPGYAPADRELVAVSLRRRTSESQAIEELMSWFGESVKEWEHLKTDVVSNALPAEYSKLSAPGPFQEKGFGVYCCGDHTETGSIQGALTSGRRAALQALGSLC